MSDTHTHTTPHSLTHSQPTQMYTPHTWIHITLTSQILTHTPFSQTYHSFHPFTNTWTHTTYTLTWEHSVTHTHTLTCTPFVKEIWQNSLHICPKCKCTRREEQDGEDYLMSHLKLSRKTIYSDLRLSSTETQSKRGSKSNADEVCSAHSSGGSRQHSLVSARLQAFAEHRSNLVRH